MQELLLVNPRKRTRKTRSAAQRAATRKLVALNKARRKNPAPARRRRRAAPKAPAVMSNPRRRTRTIVKTVRSRRRRNPSTRGNMTGMFQTALMSAAGAVTVNAAYNYLPIPATLKVGYTGYAVKAGLAMALGLFGKKFLGSRAVKMAEGSLTVTLSQVLVDVGAKAGLQLGYYSPAVQMAPRPIPRYAYSGSNGMQQMGEYLNGYSDMAGDFTMGEYVQ